MHAIRFVTSFGFCVCDTFISVHPEHEIEILWFKTLEFSIWRNLKRRKWQYIVLCVGIYQCFSLLFMTNIISKYLVSLMVWYPYYD